MAGSYLYQWWWIPIVILSRCCLLLTTDSNLPYLSQYPEEEYSEFHPIDDEVVVFLHEQCNEEVNLTDIQSQLQHWSMNLSISILPRSLTCETRSWGFGALLYSLSQPTTKALIAALDSSSCEFVSKLAHTWNKPLFTWTCPLKNLEDRRLSSIVRLSPALPSLAQALVEMFLHLQWRSAAIIGTDEEPWSSLDRVVVDALRTIGIVPRYHAILPQRATWNQVRRTLKSLHYISRRATVLCLPLNDDSTNRILTELDVSRDSSMLTSMILMIHTEDNDLFLPQIVPTASPLETPISLSFTSTQSSNFSPSDLPRTYTIVDQRTDEGSAKMNPSQRYVPSQNLSGTTLNNLLILMPLDQRYDIQEMLNGTEYYTQPTLIERLNESLGIMMHDNGTINSYNNKIYTYVVMDWRVDKWEPIMMISEEKEGLTVKRLTTNAPAFFTVENIDFIPCDADNDCTNGLLEVSVHATHIVAAILGSLFFAFLLVFLAIFIRKQLLKNRISEGPYKIILTASDFVFPQTNHTDSKTVDKGVETMLCCWLQPLQEFGGPKVEKPDLLQVGTVGSHRPYLQTSTGNLARQTFFKVRHAIYNGDLVQLKELSCQGTFELKNKTMGVLVTIHGLRHENLNPLIGCLNEPTRPCLVSEYCSRGSLEDVLVQDEIKLDWSFRLSLLTDLVRGMRYLHGTPIRVHGYLTSRNCVIDARWVLKITDYGLPAFYEAQNMSSPSKLSRDLLWTAPELLRDVNLRKKGTQPGDVYSFGIIMQEVIVRGEPFCMLALSPEDIIEKVMSPPPLIRPSVSKGAAPPEAINIMRQCWAESPDMRPDFNCVHDLFKKLNYGRKVNFIDTMFQLLEKYSNNLEELIRERTEQLDMEKKKTEQLLNRMLPNSVAEKLKLGIPVDPEEFREVTIYFSDIVGFTTISAHSTPFQVVDLLNDLYTCFDATINAYAVYKVETIGDAYMVVGGCPVRIPDHATQVATMALDLLHQSGRFKIRHLPQMQLKLRIGLHTGPCCAGVVGLTMPRYCLFGDTVNTASRMESTGAPWRIHISQATKDRLTQAGGYNIEYRGTTDVKGKGKMPTYWLLGKEGFDKKLPTPPPFGEDHGLDDSLVVKNPLNDGQAESKHLRRTLLANNRNYSIHDEEDDEDNINEKGKDNGNVKIVEGNSSNASSFETSETKKVNVSVHDEKTLEKSNSLKSTEDLFEMLKNERMNQKPAEFNDITIKKSTSSDTQISSNILAVSDTETTATILGASTTSLTSIASSVALSFRSAAASKHRRLVGGIDENDLSTPYNRYRCLSPNEHNRSSSGRLLKRQFSLDRGDEPVSIAIQEPTNQRTIQRLFKQNSAGAANDLERIEEVPSTPGHISQRFRHTASVTLSVESLTTH
ncbi:retinal guanylyl cyclase 2-like isoform X1 [Vespa mandarinia]|uniref:retinal guanylyl cyclase 2-like isoform X1 n=1 Tax=Vespa mandarinia TaxID=7446 RepID=UPI00160EC81B|nr:retinal guanylyl cyclase 2-like isoform X1 [Vespa mandarinia]XP_035725181.1 retinal guanylyl cyclase 2-like isoform X1 [Vespa mandarinia]XP_035725183.1 retinal guanylyl cyclase 2-like isoform X1 [Vespa mandarinia]XP_035725184.1 retinal guanylyl cyclase 2-like isoform X1 [Vespa mandarinia]XP_035725185.1 retinal guanylyl cyclase 2-like isoform X1 [Vespa mandarinia]XP_035725186.1 retinal guanylyl cyclase 2-like isoform X1 [Vespa mandarinia]XP_035725187.1 retinal guanylyl cyclase 2-like isofor